MAHILIIGATRGIGRVTVDEALDRGHTVRAFARSAETLGPARERFEPWAGDALSAADVREALEGVDAVVQALGVQEGPCMVVGPVTLFSEATAVLVPAMEAAGVRRLVTVTGYGAGESRSRLPLPVRIAFEAVLGRAYDDKTRQERIIEQSGLEWTIARPARLTHGPRTGRFRVFTEAPQGAYGAMSRRDVAVFLIDQVENPTALRQAPVMFA